MNFDTFSQSLLRYPDLGFSIDFSRMDIPSDYSEAMASKIEKALSDLQKLEAGAIANPDEGRMVGHYWLRNPDLAPSEEIRKQITEPIAAIKEFASMIPTGEIAPPSGGVFKNILIIGIGGACLLYKTDAADDLPRVDLGGRRIIKKKKKNENTQSEKKHIPKNNSN